MGVCVGGAKVLPNTEPRSFFSVLRFLLKKRTSAPMIDLRKVHFNQEGIPMLIGGVSSLASTVTVFNPVLASRSVQSTAPTPLEPLDTASSSPDASRSPATDFSSSNTTASSGGISAHAAAAPVAANILADSIASGYSTTVAGTQYLASLEQSGSEYTASVANVLGATSTESSELAAENNLDVRINEIV
jgi:hypothetical protein